MQVDAALPIAVETATGGNLSGAIEKLLPLEKKARVAADAKSTARSVPSRHATRYVLVDNNETVCPVFIFRR